jgi:type VI secretion system protein ImpA
MALPDLSPELPILDENAPAGPNLEFDAEFGELERAAQGKPEQQYGGTVIPAEPPVWKEVVAAAASLAERTHDLRVLVNLAVGRLQLQGLVGFVPVVGQIRFLMENRWAVVHPQLDPEDDNDPTFRSNALLQLAQPVRVLRVLRELPLASSRRDGPVSLRTIAIFRGEIEPQEDSERKTEATIRASFNDTGAETLVERQTMIDTCAKHVVAIGKAFDTETGYGNGPDLTALSKLLVEMSRAIGQYMPAGDADDAAPDEAGTGDDGGSGDADAGSAPSGASAPRSGGRGSGGFASIASLTTVNSRADALKLLDLACAYYEANEPSSPLPLLVRRARSLAEKSFLEILQDLAPDGLSQAKDVVQSRDQGD